MTLDRNPEADLDALFSESRDMTPAPSDALMARIIADADRESDRRRPMAAPTQRGLWSMITGALERLGGPGSVTALTACTVLGFGIGFIGPQDLVSITSMGADTSEFSGLFYDDALDLLDETLAPQDT